MNAFEKLMSDVRRRAARQRAEYQTLVVITRQTITQLDADLTAPDPWPWGDAYQDDQDETAAVPGDDDLPF